jgi:hypothetical protein
MTLAEHHLLQGTKTTCLPMKWMHGTEEKGVQQPYSILKAPRTQMRHTVQLLLHTTATARLVVVPDCGTRQLTPSIHPQTQNRQTCKHQHTFLCFTPTTFNNPRALLNTLQTHSMQAQTQHAGTHVATQASAKDAASSTHTNGHQAQA